ncbi:beta-1,4-galactosyltransferase 1-like [Erinaceus europaeus]|uniref:Beta-1,4-galactosyltransferase n=1 Tax=Erinaceus europaeus TaxID=9365 RepID=A0ABM3XUU8_ERIEU|nr:beta-1,4-galactosyltransferase 1-like [Erinaceus europaeus]
MLAVGLQRPCCLLLAVCALYLGVFRLLYLACSHRNHLPRPGRAGPAQPQGGVAGAPTSPQLAGELRPPAQGLQRPVTFGSPPGSGGRSSSSGPASNLTLTPAPPPGAQSLPLCPVESPLLRGPLRIDSNPRVNLKQVETQNPQVALGGRYRPRNCTCPQKVAIVIPFRNREAHLSYWLHCLHPVLQRQQLDYGVYVITQAGEQLFNRAKLLNVGFREALQDGDYDCFVFSDVDLVPMDDRNAYRCFPQPRHLSVLVDRFGFFLPYQEYFGGVSAMSKQQFLATNGFSNNYWGWGGEDDDMFNRLTLQGMSLSRPRPWVSKFRMLRHWRDKKNEASPQRFQRVAQTKEAMFSDGLNTLSYRVVGRQRHPLYTQITVDIGSPS